MRGWVARSYVVTVMLGIFACSSSSSPAPANDVGPGGTCQGDACGSSSGPGPTPAPGPTPGPGPTPAPEPAPNDTDGIKNNGETDIDCGGPNAKKCAVGKTCVAGPDCGLGYCPAATCVAPSASDSVQNGTETDVDCGGAAQTFDGVTVAAAPKCALALKCMGDGDCGSAICADN